jgi:NAD(P)-dependent dehydrogenase (short-subunit alcohol dehydrogenase family)
VEADPSDFAIKPTGIPIRESGLPRLPRYRGLLASMYAPNTPFTPQLLRPLMKLEGRRILITGASSGIGLEVARLFAKEGASLALIARHADNSSAMRDSLVNPERHVSLAGDVTQEADVERFVSEASAALGGLDGLVNSAGVDHVAPFEATTVANWRRVIDTNMTGTFIVCQQSLAPLRESGDATIVNLASGAGLLPLSGRTAYCAAKAGLIMFSKTLALEVAADGIRVNTLCPGAIDTPMLRESAGGAVGDPVPAPIVARFAMGRVGEADEIARAILFLSCADSSFVTGTALAADGGRTFH